MIVFLLTGLWHGASWNFVLWGLFHGTFLCIERVFLSNWLSKFHAVISHLYTLFVVGIGWAIFRIEEISRLKEYLLTMFDFRGSVDLFEIDSLVDYSESTLAIICGCILCMPLVNIFRHILGSLGVNNLKPSAHKMLSSFSIGFSTSLLLVFSLAKISADTYNPFIYFRF